MTTQRRFPIGPGTPSPGSLNLGITMPAAPVAAEPAGSCTPSGPYMSTCIQQFPDNDSKLFVFACWGLSEADVVTWDVTLGDFDVVVGVQTAQVLVIQYLGGPGGAVTATVNGTQLDTIDYATNDQQNACVPKTPTED